MYFSFFLLYPVLEIIVFVLLAKAIGWASTLLLALATSFVGATLLQSRSIRIGLAQNQYSARTIENYLFINLGCFLLILPGFLTDFLGLILMIPVSRRLLLGLARLCRLDLRGGAKGPFSVFRAYRFGDDFSFPPDPGASFTPSSGDDTLNVDSISPKSAPQSDANIAQRSGNTEDDEPIDVEFTIRK